MTEKELLEIIEETAREERTELNLSRQGDKEAAG